VITKDNVKTRRFLVTDQFQLILVEPSPSPKRMGWGVAKFVGFLQVLLTNFTPILVAFVNAFTHFSGHGSFGRST